MCNFSINIDFLNFVPTPMCNFSVNIEFLDSTFSVSTKGKRLYRSRCYLAVLRQPLEELMCLRISLPLSYAKLRWRLFRNTRVRHRKATAIRVMMPIACQTKE